tara:strand:+ start:19876 stop:20214 length:339 start_codon:yes stop_codon:yes gene_type:complete
LKYLFILFLFILNSLYTFEKNNSPLISSHFFQYDSYEDEKITVYYSSNTLFITGLNGFGNVYVYSIIGNPLYSFKNQYLENFSTPVNLKPNNLFIVRIELKDGIKTFKILSN